MKVKIVAFAWAKDVVGVDELQLDLPSGATVEDVMSRLSDDYPKLAERSGVLTIAVNQEFVKPGHVVHEEDEIALIPPISGGGNV